MAIFIYILNLCMHYLGIQSTKLGSSINVNKKIQKIKIYNFNKILAPRDNVGSEHISKTD